MCSTLIYNGVYIQPLSCFEIGGIYILFPFRTDCSRAQNRHQSSETEDFELCSQSVLASQRYAYVSFLSFTVVCIFQALPAAFAAGWCSGLLFGERRVRHTFGQATDSDATSQAGKCSIGFPAPFPEAQGRSIELSFPHGVSGLVQCRFSVLFLLIGCKCNKNIFLFITIEGLWSHE